MRKKWGVTSKNSANPPFLEIVVVQKIVTMRFLGLIFVAKRSFIWYNKKWLKTSSNQTRSVQ